MPTIQEIQRLQTITLQAVPSGGRSFLIETATVLVCMPWPKEWERHALWRQFRASNMEGSSRFLFNVCHCSIFQEESADLSFALAPDCNFSKVAACSLYACHEGQDTLKSYICRIVRILWFTASDLSVTVGHWFNKNQIQAFADSPSFGRQPSKTQLAKTVPRTSGGRWLIDAWQEQSCTPLRLS